MPTNKQLPRIGVVSFSDGRRRVHEGLLASIETYQRTVAQNLDHLGVEPVIASQVVWTPRLAVRQAKELLAQDVAGAVFNIPVFAFPNLSAICARVLGRPVALMSPAEPGLPGLGGLLAASGALEQVCLTHSRIYGPYDDERSMLQLGRFVAAAAAKHCLQGQVYGQIGGRSIGMLTGVSSSPAEWLRVFGVDIDHTDESEILRIAESVSPSERERMVAWLEENLRSVQYGDGGKLTRQHLQFQVACAAAVKRIIKEKQYDFIGIKCHYDMSEYYCTQCLSAAFLPSLIDWDGQREPVVCACEADGDGALTMQILQLITGEPSLFLDLRHYDDETGLWTLCNCGGQSNFYALRDEDPRRNLARVDLVPVIAKYGGVGAHVRYVSCEGPLTFARIMHDGTGPVLLAFSGEAVPADDAWLDKSCPSWPHVFAMLDPEKDDIIEELRANHVHAVSSYHLAELEAFAQMVGIPYIELL